MRGAGAVGLHAETNYRVVSPTAPGFDQVFTSGPGVAGGVAVGF